MRILVTGGNGMLAHALAGHCREMGDQIYAPAREQLDISDSDAVSAAIRISEAEAVINCAAYTDVDGSESDPSHCFEVNCYSVERLAKATSNLGIKFITISTDYVFDGTKPDFYTEEDQPNPLGVYAKAKREGEILSLAANPDALVVRAGWIYGPGGKNFLSKVPELLSGGFRIKAISDALGMPTHAKDLAERLREIAGTTASGILHVANTGEGTSFYGFADKVCELRGYDKSLIDKVSFRDLKRPAPRPVSSKMRSVREKELGLSPLRSWEKALEDFLS